MYIFTIRNKIHMEHNAIIRNHFFPSSRMLLCEDETQNRLTSKLFKQNAKVHSKKEKKSHYENIIFFTLPSCIPSPSSSNFFFIIKNHTLLELIVKWENSVMKLAAAKHKTFLHHFTLVQSDCRIFW